MSNDLFLFYIVSMITLLCGLPGCESKPTDKIDQAKAIESSINIAKGQELYLSYGCAVCHGTNGDGKGIAKGLYPPPTNFYNLKTYQRGTDVQSMRNSIRYGIKGQNSVMPAFDLFTEKELDQIVSYLESLQTK